MFARIFSNHDQIVLSNLFCSTLNLLLWFDCSLIGFALVNWLINYDQFVTQHLKILTIFFTPVKYTRFYQFLSELIINIIFLFTTNNLLHQPIKLYVKMFVSLSSREGRKQKSTILAAIRLCFFIQIMHLPDFLLLLGNVDKNRNILR